MESLWLVHACSLAAENGDVWASELPRKNLIVPVQLCKHADADIGCYRKFFPDELPQKLYVKLNLEKFRKLERRQTNGSAAELLKDFWEIDALGPDKNQPWTPIEDEITRWGSLCMMQRILGICRFKVSRIRLTKFAHIPPKRQMAQLTKLS